MGLATMFMPVASSYHTMVCPGGAVAVAVSVGIGFGLQWNTAWLPPLTGAATAVPPTVTASVVVVVWHAPALAKTVTLPLALPGGKSRVIVLDPWPDTSVVPGGIFQV